MMNSVFRTKPPTRSVTQINVEPGRVKVSVQLVTVQGRRRGSVGGDRGGGGARG
jgi:hypothetical protein